MPRRVAGKATVIAVAARNGQGYRWQWRSVDGGAASERAFDLFYDCLDDARSKGYDVEPPPPPPALQL